MIPLHEPILIADDVPHMARLLQSYLEELGFTRFTLVDDGTAVVSLARDQRFGLMLLDIEMPHMNGLQALEVVRSVAPETPVVIVSGQGTHENVVKAVKLGAKGFLVKPYTKQKVVEIVQHLGGPAPVA